MFSIKGKPEDFVGKDIREIAVAVKPLIKDFSEFMNRAEDILKDKKVFADEKIPLMNGMYLSRSYIPLNYNNEYHGGVWIYKDISDEEKISQMKSDFVSLVSHQLKTPVAQIKGYVENMIEGLTGEINAKQKDYLSDMLNVANKNSKLIDDLLNISRIERGLLKVTIEPLVIDELLTDVLQPLHTIAEAKGVILTEKLLGKKTAISGDPVKTREALRNIVDNAIKFTEKDKKVTVVAKENQKNITVSISDQGMGIDPDVQQELFSKNRVWAGKVKASGAGLGLFLSKQFIELTGGTITFESSPGKGTTFIITFKKI
jgi:signal transduction histidine kinase